MGYRPGQRYLRTWASRASASVIWRLKLGRPVIGLKLVMDTRRLGVRTRALECWRTSSSQDGRRLFMVILRGCGWGVRW